MNLTEAKELAISLMTKYNLIKLGWKFDFNNRARSAGLCSYRKKIIYLSRIITELESYEFVKDVILHEIAHSLTPGHHHNEVWKKKAIEIGCNGDRCFQHKKENLENIAKYKGVCPNGHEFFRMKKPKDNISQSCGFCDKTGFNRNYKIYFYKISK